MDCVLMVIVFGCCCFVPLWKEWSRWSHIAFYGLMSTTLQLNSESLFYTRYKIYMVCLLLLDRTFWWHKDKWSCGTAGIMVSTSVWLVSLRLLTGLEFKPHMDHLLFPWVRNFIHIAYYRLVLKGKLNKQRAFVTNEQKGKWFRP